MSVKREYREKIYAGLLGKCIGIRLGAPVEPTIWTYERIRAAYGEITNYVKDFRIFAADDDFNGPVFFVRALLDHALDRPLEARDVGRAWLNYTREEKGFYWWGGYGRSTEHTAYLNLKSGMEAPASGSAAVNGKIIAEQIGGQIFIDTWGLVFGGEPAKAARHAALAASVSHDGEGLHGARFIAGAIAEAFNPLPKGGAGALHLVNTGLSLIPAGSEYARVAKAVVDFHAKEPGDWRACMDFLTKNFGYDRYPGVCHIIPNAGVCVLALLYGGLDLARTVEIATMCGWDTDCNAGNVGTIVGVAVGIDGIAQRYRRPMEDFFAASSIAGSLNIVDLPTLARELEDLGLYLAGDASRRPSLEAKARRDLAFDFSLPGSTHGFRSSVNYLQVGHRRLEEGGCLEVLVDRLPKGAGARLYHKPFYRREDFDDERYSPAFSPTAYSGQVMTCLVKSEKMSGPLFLAIPYARVSSDKSLVEGKPLILTGAEDWVPVEFTLPDAQGSVLDEVGFALELEGEDRYLGRLLVKDFRISGPASYHIDFSKHGAEFATVTPGVCNRGFWEVVGNRLCGLSVGPAEFYTGNYHSADYAVAARIAPLSGSGHCLMLRAQGASRSYAAGFVAPGKLGILANDGAFESLASLDFPWKDGETYELRFEANQDRLTLWVNGEKHLEARDGRFRHGMVGFQRSQGGRAEFSDLKVQELA